MVKRSVSIPLTSVLVLCMLCVSSTWAKTFKQHWQPFMQSSVDINTLKTRLNEIETSGGTQSLPSYVKTWLASPSSLTRHKALLLYGGYGGAAHADTLARQAIVDKNALLRELSASLIKKINYSKAPPLLVAAVSNKNPIIAMRAATALAMVGDTVAAGAMAFALSRSEERYDAYIFVSDQRSYIKDWDVEDGRLQPVIGTYGVGAFMGVKGVTVHTFRRHFTQQLNIMLPNQRSDNWQVWASRHKALFKHTSS